MKNILSFLSYTLFGLTFFCQEADDVVGKWINPTKTAIIEIKKTNDFYVGKMVWLSEIKEQLDLYNDTESLRSRKVVGIEIVSGMIFNEEDKIWEEGEVYVPKQGTFFDAYLELLSYDALKVKGFVGFSWVGKSEIWSRYTSTSYPVQ